MKHVVQYSTGAASAEVAWRVHKQYGRADLILLTANTSVEDADNWRYANDVHSDLDCPEWVVLTDGRTPMQVGRDRRCVPSNQRAVCSEELKRKLLRRWINENCDPEETIIYLGYDWTEPERMEKAIPHWKPYQVKAPLLDPPYVSKPDLLDAWRVRGIEPPRLYSMGFHHANCGGGCVRGGQAQWALLHRVMPDRYREWENEEEETRAFLGKDVAIMRHSSGPRKGAPLTLRAFRERIEAQPSLFDGDDWGACACTE